MTPDEMDTYADRLMKSAEDHRVANRRQESVSLLGVAASFKQAAALGNIHEVLHCILIQMQMGHP